MICAFYGGQLARLSQLDNILVLLLHGGDPLPNRYSVTPEPLKIAAHVPRRMRARVVAYESVRERVQG